MEGITFDLIPKFAAFCPLRNQWQWHDLEISVTKSTWRTSECCKLFQSDCNWGLLKTSVKSRVLQV